MKKVSSFLILLFGFIANIQAFSTVADTVIIPIRMLHPTDSIEVTVEYGTKFLRHTVKKGQTLYSISKYYGLDAGDMTYYNSTLVSGMKLGQKLKIPIGRYDIKWQKNSQSIKWRMIEVVYIVKPKDTVYKIAKTYFNMSLDAFRALNNMKNDTLEIGHKVIVGWIDIDGIPEKSGVRAWLPISLYPSYKKMKTKYINAKVGEKEIKEKGPATWNKNSHSDNLYALHKDAPIGTILKVTNPLNNRTLYVKVIGKLQTAGYGYDTILVLSPAVAKALAGVNRNFRVNISYYL
jgi:LysM repeat protein